MLVLLGYGALAALITDRNLMNELSALSPSFRLPSIGLPSLGLRDVVQAPWCSRSRSRPDPQQRDHRHKRREQRPLP